jgi:hypothetical protein
MVATHSKPEISEPPIDAKEDVKQTEKYCAGNFLGRKAGKIES